MLIKQFATFCFVVVITFGFVLESRAQTSTVLTTGLRAPQKIIFAPQQGFFLVSESGNPAVNNSGRVSVVFNSGNRFTLVDGLPSGVAPPNNDPSGPSALFIQGDKLYIAISAGNSVLAGPVPASEIPNPNPNSPIFSSVLEYTFHQSGFRTSGSDDNVLADGDHVRLANGETVYVSRFGKSRGSLRLVADFPNFTPAPRPGFPDLVRSSNPYGLVLHANTLYVVNASQNNIQTVNLANGAIGTLISYPARPNPATPFGPPFIDAVPDSLRLFGNKLVVTFLTGFPFNPGAADVRQYDLQSGTDSQLIGGLTSAIDALPVDEGGFCSSFYTLEFSTNQLAGAPGRLQRFDSPTATPTIISNSLISPTSMARHPQSGDFLITEIFTGRVIRINL